MRRYLNSTRADSRHTSAPLQLALRLEAITIIWMVVEAVVSIAAGVMASSLLLLAFGIDSIIELISAAVLMWRLYREAQRRDTDPEELEALEQRASRIAGYLLYALILYVLVQAVFGLVHRHQADVSVWGLAVAATAALGMPVLARAKIRVADAIGSKALRADAMETFTCGYLSWVLLVGLAANFLVHWWWLDAIASLIVLPLLLREAKAALSDEGCCGHCG